VGVLREDKNLRSLIRAVAMLPESLRKRFVCILIGPDYRDNASKYLSLSEELGCRSNFDYIGPLYGQAKYDALESSDAYVMPSFSEVFSLAMLDAMGCGKPCLASSGCGYNYFVENDFFVACEPYSQDIARGLHELFEREADWLEMGKRARCMVEEKFNWKMITDETLINYKRIVGQI
jgi:glycosyltransferase involved in cell wall biosynthesis